MELHRGVQAPPVATLTLQDGRRGHPEWLCQWSPLTHSPLKPSVALEPQTQPPSPSQPFVSWDPGQMEQCPGFLWTTLSTPVMDRLPWCYPTDTSSDRLSPGLRSHAQPHPCCLQSFPTLTPPAFLYPSS